MYLKRRRDRLDRLSTMFTNLDAFIFPGALKYLYEYIQYMDGRFSIGFFYQKDLIDLIILMNTYDFQLSFLLFAL